MQGDVCGLGPWILNPRMNPGSGLFAVSFGFVACEKTALILCELPGLRLVCLVSSTLPGTRYALAARLLRVHLDLGSSFDSEFGMRCA